ncbi:hypothetical protein HYU50_01085 [Candidatus Woesearchaeota archaeon]|nr:hypothetical protein [Candidatus Woesearchaeota archaeon]
MKTGKRNKAQFAMEFVILISFMFIIFLSFIAVITSKILDARESERQQTAEDIATLAKNEIELAISVSDGYARVFTLPATIEGNSYDISIENSRELVVTYLDKEYVLFLEDNVVGNIVAGSNQIRKTDGVVYLQAAGLECDDAIDNDGDLAVDMADAGCTGSLDTDETNCGDSVCEGYESCSICQADCGICPSVISLLMKSISNAMSFDITGNAILKGSLSQGIPNPPITNDDEFIFKDRDNNAVTVVNLVTGDMFIKGSLFENQESLNPSAASNDFIVKDSSGNILSFIDETGNFYLKGALTQTGNP